MPQLQRLPIPSADRIRLCVALLALTAGASACQKNEVVAQDRRIAVMSALPLFGTTAEPDAILNGPDQRAAIIQTLSELYHVTPLARVDAPLLAKSAILILAQPRVLSGEELVALDTWVRNGGRVLVFTDPELLWPSDLPLGDPRRAPPIGLLDPLLAHWGLALESPAMSDAGPVQTVKLGDAKLAVAWAGRWTLAKPGCRVEAEGLVAACRIGKGRALLVADADLLDDRLWAESGVDNESVILALIARVAAAK